MNHTITPELIIHYGQVQSENDRLRAELRAADDRATEYINALSYARAELAELRARVAVPDDVAKDALEDLADTVSLALSKAWSLGQTYWSQADSESYKQNKKAAETQQTFNALTDATRAAILAAKEKGQ